MKVLIIAILFGVIGSILEKYHVIEKPSHFALYGYIVGFVSGIILMATNF